MTPAPPATGDVFGQLALVRIIPVVVLDEPGRRRRRPR